MTCDLPEWYEYTEPVAMKNHACCECSAPILKGEKHFHGRGKWPFGVASYRQHVACMEACMCIRDDFSDGECIGFGSLFEDFDEMKWQYDRVKDRHNAPWVKLRRLIATIKLRERRVANG